MEGFMATFSVVAIPILLAITLHEAAHGYVANHFGDPTAKMLGRLSLNPIRHIDPMGTILLPAGLLLLSGGTFAFGYAKPVPVDTRNFKNPKRDMVWVALAGPGANIFLAVVGALLLNLSGVFPGILDLWLVQNLNFLVLFNCLLAVFNMLPIPPLDGSRVVAGFLKGPIAYQYARLEQFGIFIVLGILFILPMLFAQAGIYLPIGEFLIFDPALDLYTFLVETLGGGAGIDNTGL